MKPYQKAKNYTKHGNLDVYMGARLGPKFREYRNIFNGINVLELTGFPTYVIVETQSGCNYKCRMCRNSQPIVDEPWEYDERMDIPTFKRIVDECVDHGCQAMSLCDANEPLLDRHLMTRIYYAARRMTDVNIITNGFLLISDRSRALIDSGLTRLWVGLDATTEETYGKIRKETAFNRICDNIFRFLDIRGGNVFPVLRVSFCVTSINEHEQEEFLEIWGDIADSVTFQRYTPHNDTMKFLSLVPSGFHDMAFECIQPFERLTITGNGNVFPCCPSRAKPAGNIHENTIREIWHSDAFAEKRRIVKEKDWAAAENCTRCITTR